MDANPDRSTYAFCIDTRKGKAGYFYLCFKANRGSPVMTWDVRVIPKGYELLKNSYPDMRALCNGFKLRYHSELQKRQQVRGGR